MNKATLARRKESSTPPMSSCPYGLNIMHASGLKKLPALTEYHSIRTDPPHHTPSVPATRIPVQSLPCTRKAPNLHIKCNLAAESNIYCDGFHSRRSSINCDTLFLGFVAFANLLSSNVFFASALALPLACFEAAERSRYHGRLKTFLQLLCKRAGSGWQNKNCDCNEGSFRTEFSSEYSVPTMDLLVPSYLS